MNLKPMQKTFEYYGRAAITVLDQPVNLRHENQVSLLEENSLNDRRAIAHLIVIDPGRGKQPMVLMFHQAVHLDH